LEIRSAVVYFSRPPQVPVLRDWPAIGRTHLRGYSAVNTPCGTTNACAFGPGSKLINDPIGRISVSDSAFKVATATTSTFPFGDQIQAVEALTLKNVVRNGTRLPDGTYAAP
jgi:hypothetical protein